VFASPGNGFPFAAIEAMACDTPVVAARTPTTSEILEGAAVLVDAAPTTDVADAAAALATKDAPRTLVVAAGRARANDFSLGGRGPELVSLLHRALASR
jgi:glycosyltransferase involved in cell wall biosynthesis